MLQEVLIQPRKRQEIIVIFILSFGFVCHFKTKKVSCKQVENRDMKLGNVGGADFESS